VADESVEAVHCAGCSGTEVDERRPGRGHARELREGAFVVVDVFDHIEGADQVENRIAVRQSRDEAERCGASRCAQFRQCRCTDIDELRILDRQARRNPGATPAGGAGARRDWTSAKC